MKLRSCDHLHFIQAISGSFVSKTLNVDSRGRQMLKFKTIEEIYKKGDGKHVVLHAKQGPQDCLLLDSDNEMTENLGPFLVERTKGYDPETCSQCKEEQNCDPDDLCFGEMTLKQLRDSYKTKKRKHATSTGMNTSTGTCSPVKQENNSTQTDEDEFYHKEPLSNWRAKISRNLKVKRKRAKKHVSSSSELVVTVKSEQISGHHDSSCFITELDIPFSVKLEVLGPDCSESEVEISGWNDSLLCCAEKDSSPGTLSIKENEESDLPVQRPLSHDVNEVVNEYAQHVEPIPLLPARHSCTEMLPDDDPQMTGQRSFVHKLQSCVVNEASDEYAEHVELIPVLPTSVSGCERLTVDDPQVSSQRSFIHKQQNCIVNGVCYAYEEHVEPATLLPACTSSSEILMVGDPVVTCMQSLVSCLVEPERENIVTQTVPDGSFLEKVSQNRGSNPDMEDCSPEDSVPGFLIVQGGNSNGLQSDVLTHGDDSYMFPDVGKKSLAEVAPVGSPANHTGTNYISPLHAPLRPHSNWVSADDSTITTSEQEAVMPSCINETKTVAADSHPCSSTNESAATEASPTRSDHHPERLLSTRKAISPSSQEKLCQAMDCMELYEDVGNFKSRGKLCFGEQPEKWASSAGAVLEDGEIAVSTDRHAKIINSSGTRTQVSCSPKKILQKPKNEKRSLQREGILKVPRLSRASTGGNNTQSCVESAISFSQRQMHDIERLANMLTNELTSIKSMMEETFHSEACPAAFPNYNGDEVGKTIERANKAEETAKRWLSMMTRDCNRFCKIMRQNEKGTVGVSTGIGKEKRRITFADEAGGSLCHVKFYWDDMNTVSEEK
ncbi:hypothetical protein RJ641_028983 [Dillenia turbinata]|uniref:Uncharacterized protein n=1 Tax=Dillenia turbinata TaxID=194707 RepID=A0AAN8ZIZ3_9MAGN